MKKKWAVTLLVLGLSAGAVFATRSLRPHPDEVLRQRNAERSLGDPKAPLWITEYFDYQCPPCARASLILEEAMAERPGKIYLQVRYFPMPAHPHALKAAVYAECVSRQKGKFWAYHKEVFANQPQWAVDPYPELRFAAYAETAGVDVKALDACAHDPAAEKAVMEERKKAEEIGVRGTPSFYLNGKLVVGPKAMVTELDAFFAEKEAQP